MVRCVNCGQGVAQPVWAVYADPAFARKQQQPFPLHGDCFEMGRTITAQEWNTGATELVETGDHPRYRRVAPEEE